MQGGCQVSKALNRQKMKNGKKGKQFFQREIAKKGERREKVKKIILRSVKSSKNRKIVKRGEKLKN
jgi:hypothetical protein